jgi:hypothetical protein
MKPLEEEEFDLKYETPEIEKMILDLLKKHPNGMVEGDIIAEMPKDINRKVLEAMLPLFIHRGSLLPIAAYTINKNKNRKSPYVGFLNKELNEILGEEEEGREYY